MNKILLFAILGMISMTACTRKVAKVVVKDDVTTEVTKPEKPAVDDNSRTPKGVYPVIKMKRGACYGQCPSYDVSINSDGSVDFVGYAFVKDLGANRGNVSKDVLKKLIDKAREIDYLGMENEYPINGKKIDDLPTISTQVIIGDMVKNVTDHFDSPPALQAFEVMIDEVVRGIEYKRVEVEKK